MGEHIYENFLNHGDTKLNTLVQFVCMDQLAVPIIHRNSKSNPRPMKGQGSWFITWNGEVDIESQGSQWADDQSSWALTC